MTMRHGQPKESPPARHEQGAELLSVTDNQVQVMLALRLINEKLPGLDATVLRYEDADPSVKKEAMAKWLEGGESLSAQYRAFIEDPAHKGMQVNVADPRALDALLGAIRSYPVTMH